MDSPHFNHQTDDSDLVNLFALLDDEQVTMRPDFESSLQQSLYAVLEKQSSSEARSIRERMRGWLAISPSWSLRPVMTAAVFAVALIFIVGIVVGTQLYSIGSGEHFAILNLDSGSVSVTRAVPVLGDIELTRHLDARPGEDMRIFKGDVVNSGQDTVAVLVLPDKSRMEIGAHSALDITDLQARSETRPLTVAMHLQRGAVRTEVEHLISEADRFEVSTPDLIAQVKGTVFRLDVGSEGTRVATDEGLVRVNYDGQAIDVAAGRELSLLMGETMPAVDVRPQSPQLQSDLLAKLEGIDDNGRQVYYTNAIVIPWQIQSLPNAHVLFYVNEELYTRVPTDAMGQVTVDFSPPAEIEYRIFAVTEMLTTETSLPSPEQVILVDRTPPSLVLQEPTEPQVTEAEVTVSGLTEPQTALTLNGELVSVDESGMFRYLLNLEPGANELDLVATDLAGNSIRLGSVIVYE